MPHRGRVACVDRRVWLRFTGRRLLVARVRSYFDALLERAGPANTGVRNMEYSTRLRPVGRILIEVHR